MFAESVIILKHLLIGAHVKVSFELVEITKLELWLAFYHTTHFNWVAIIDSLFCCLVEVHDLDFFLYTNCANKSLISKRCRIFCFNQNWPCPLSLTIWCSQGEAICFDLINLAHDCDRLAIHPLHETGIDERVGFPGHSEFNVCHFRLFNLILIINSD